MNETEIQTQIQKYLIAKVNSYNTQLQRELNNRTKRQNDNKDAFVLLSKADTMAVPRDYKVLDPSYLIQEITKTDKQAIENIAHILYIQNSPRPERQYSSKFGQEYDLL